MGSSGASFLQAHANVHLINKVQGVSQLARRVFHGGQMARKYRACAGHAEPMFRDGGGSSPILVGLADALRVERSIQQTQRHVPWRGIAALQPTPRCLGAVPDGLGKRSENAPPLYQFTITSEHCFEFIGRLATTLCGTSRINLRQAQWKSPRMRFRAGETAAEAHPDHPLAVASFWGDEESGWCVSS